jgi:hypothetical protein
MATCTIPAGTIKTVQASVEADWWTAEFSSFPDANFPERLSWIELKISGLNVYRTSPRLVWTLPILIEADRLELAAELALLPWKQAQKQQRAGGALSGDLIAVQAALAAMMEHAEILKDNLIKAA